MRYLILTISLAATGSIYRTLSEAWLDHATRAHVVMRNHWPELDIDRLRETVDALEKELGSKNPSMRTVEDLAAQGTAGFFVVMRKFETGKTR